MPLLFFFFLGGGGFVKNCLHGKNSKPGPFERIIEEAIEYVLRDVLPRVWQTVGY
jgi:hypothetical protein